MKHATLAILALVAMTACAQSPDAIAPVSMAGAFDGVSCRNASIMLSNERQTLAALSKKQKDAVAGDAIGVFLIGVPMSSLTGNDQEGNIATSKGKIVALENRMLSCG